MTKKKPTRRRTTIKRSAALRLRVKGPDIRSGGIPIPDLLVICQHTQSAIDRQAEALEGQRTLRPGPTTEKVRDECTLELVGISKGSAVLTFEQAKPQPVFPVMPSLGIEAIEKVGLAIDSLAKGRGDDVDPGVLSSLNKMGELFQNGVKSVEWIVPRHGRHRSVRATFNTRVHTRVVARVKPAVTGPVTVDGILEMADFKPTDFRCRIHPTLGAVINCTFNTSLADEIYSALRHPVRSEGCASINQETQRIETIEITSLKPLDPLTVDAGSFFRGWTFDQLAHMQAISPMHDAKVLAGGWPADEEVDDVLVDVYKRRA